MAVLLFVSCTKDPIVIDQPSPEEEDSILLWKVPLHPDTLKGLSINNISLYENKVVTSLRPTGEKENLMCFDTSGELIWEWSDYARLPNIQTIDDEGMIGGDFYFTTWYNDYCIDINTGEEKWRHISDDGGPRISSDGKGLIAKPTSYFSGAPSTDSTSLFTTKIESGAFKEVFTIPKIEGKAVNIPSVAFDKNEEGDDILIFQNNTLFTSPYNEIMDLYSFNMVTKEVMWKKEFSGETSWNVHEPLLENENIYFATKFRFFSINKYTGEINWERLMPHDFQGSNYLLYQDVLITNLDNGDLIAIDKHTGYTVWHNENLSECCVDLYIFGDKLYMGNDDLFIVDPLTGELLFRYTTPTQKEKGRGSADFFDGVAVDLEEGKIYITDSYYLLCLKHPDI